MQERRERSTPALNRPSWAENPILYNFAALLMNEGKKVLNYKGEENLEPFRQAINEGNFPIIYSNHQSHADGAVISEIVARLRLEGVTFYIPVATSLASGHQGKVSQALFFGMDQYFGRIGIKQLPVTREKDRNEFGLPLNRESMAKIGRMPSHGEGLIIFPEGTMKGGRKKSDGKINGMQEVDEPSVPHIIKKSLKGGQKAVLLPVGINGTHRIYSPTTRLPTREFLKVLAGKKNGPALADITIGPPFLGDDFRNFEADTSKFYKVLMGKVAELLPQEAQGEYRKSIAV